LDYTRCDSKLAPQLKSAKCKSALFTKDPELKTELKKAIKNQKEKSQCRTIRTRKRKAICMNKITIYQSNI
jgi:hypothetical protein